MVSCLQLEYFTWSPAGFLFGVVSWLRGWTGVVFKALLVDQIS